MKRALTLLVLTVSLRGAEPLRTSWIMAAGPFQPDVRSVEETESEVVVRSGGISLQNLGPLATVPRPREEIRQFVYRFPLRPARETGVHAHVPQEYAGAFLNGVPIYNQFETASYRGQNLWHYDMVARNRETARPGLIEALITDSRRHSPIIGFALDGFPVYGPWGENGGLKRMRSSYRLRNIAVRDHWPDGTQLAPGQYGPPVNPDYPLGSFVEDYEYVAGAGDLDQFNGRTAVTAEYPTGTYAYFLATDSAGKPAFPYLIGSQFAGRYRGPPGAPVFPLNKASLNRGMGPAGGQAVTLQLDGLPHYLEYVHERPIHLLVVSEDLAWFDHVHPEVNELGAWQVTYKFPHGGRFRVYADYTPPGANQRLDSFDVMAQGPSGSSQPLAKADFVSRAGEDTMLEFPAPLAGLQPWLGAWAHVAIAGEGLSSFVHAHPVEEGSSLKPSEVHTHGADALGPAPSRIQVPVSFPKAGLYKVWVQFQVAGKVETHPYVVRADAVRRATRPAAVPVGAIRILITSHGFEPMRVEIPAGRQVTLAFVRSAEPNCGSKIVFPELGIAKDVPLGGVAIVTLPPQQGREIMFACGMGMLRGSVVAVAAPK